MTGPAVVHLRGGIFVAGHAELENGVITFTGRRRLHDLSGERLYAERTRSHRLRAGEWVEWTLQAPASDVHFEVAA
jgi:hypothetical protein